MKEIIIYCESAQISKNIANNSILKRGSVITIQNFQHILRCNFKVIAMKGEFLRCKGFGTPVAGTIFAMKILKLSFFQF